MRLAVVAHHVAPIAPPFAGGVESLTWYLTRWLAQRGHDVVCFAPPGSAIPGVEVRELALDPELAEASRRDVSMPPEKFLNTHHAYQRTMLELADDADRFDLVNVHSLHYLPVAMASLVPAPVLLTLHTPPTPWLESALRCGGETLPALSAVSATTARLWAPVVRVPSVLTNGVSLEDWPAGPGGTAAAWCGRMVPEKAPHLAIDAARAAGLALRIAGPIVDPAYWDAEVAPRLGDDVRYAGHLSHPELAQLLGSSCVALLTPEWEEPFGLAAAEAIACGTPVAAFDRGGLGGVIGADAGRLVPASDVLTLAAAALEAAELPRPGVRAYARRHLGLDAMGRRYEALYDRLLDRRGAELSPA